MNSDEKAPSVATEDVAQPEYFDNGCVHGAEKEDCIVCSTSDAVLGDEAEKVDRVHFDSVCQQRDDWIAWARAMLADVGASTYQQSLPQNNLRTLLSAHFRAPRSEALDAERDEVLRLERELAVANATIQEYVAREKVIIAASVWEDEAIIREAEAIASEINACTKYAEVVKAITTALRASRSRVRADRIEARIVILAEAIANAAQRVGIYNGEVPLTGPDLLQLCDDLSTNVEALEAELKAIQECDKCDLCEDHHAQVEQEG